MFITCEVCSGQKQGNIWYFGDHVGLDFNSGVPVVLNNGQLFAYEGTAVMCDSSGALLFYTNGFQIWNRNHQVMPNGDSLMGNYYLSSTQAALIIPQPGSNRFFYVFTTDDFFHNLLYGLRYSIVDICLDNGFGDVIQNQKNILMLDTVAEKLTGVRHSNGTDYWVITHKYYSDAFYSYHLSATGIVDTVISHVGSVHPTFPVTPVGAIGQLKASPNGQKLAIVNGNANPAIAEYFNFDKATGIVSNCVSVQTNPSWMYYGVSFSPDNSKLYIACSINGNGIYQFDLNSGGGNPDSVRASKVQVAAGYNYFALQLAINGKIYCTRSPYGSIMEVINNPNNPGLSCNYADSALYLNGNLSWYGFPNFIDSYDYSNTTYNCQTGINENDQTENNIILPNPFNNFLSITTSDNRLYKITLYDITSRKLLQQSFTNSTSLNTSQLSKAIYIYELRTKNGVIKNGKVVKD
jgi:hypothetical protein